ncbi:hypothetical protein BH24ACT3_BH24ACT3_12120 [soil metagenome]
MPRSDAVLKGRTFITDDATAQRAHKLLADRYGWQWNIVPMIPIPGVKSAHRHLGLRERIRLMRAKELWEACSIIGIDTSGS